MPPEIFSSQSQEVVHFTLFNWEEPAFAGIICWLLIIFIQNDIYKLANLGKLVRILSMQIIYSMLQKWLYTDAMCNWRISLKDQN